MSTSFQTVPPTQGTSHAHTIQFNANLTANRARALRHVPCSSVHFSRGYARTFPVRSSINAMRRAETIALQFIEKRARRVTCDDCIITLDGIGNNRRAFKKTFACKKLPCPRIITCECEPVVALCQRILYGNDVLLTSGDPTIRSKRRLHGGVAPPLIEDLILANRLPLNSVNVLYLDYCGGPPSSVDMRRVLSKFHNLEIYAATISRRQHAGIEQTFAQYIPSMYGYSVSGALLDNHRVVCQIYTCSATPRNVAIPGCFWINCPKKLKRKRFLGILVSETTAAVETERGLEFVYLNKSAKKAYAVSTAQTHNYQCTPARCT
jgi:hypothetical protein